MIGPTTVSGAAAVAWSFSAPGSTDDPPPPPPPPHDTSVAAASNALPTNTRRFIGETSPHDLENSPLRTCGVRPPVKARRPRVPTLRDQSRRDFPGAGYQARRAA